MSDEERTVEDVVLAAIGEVQAFADAAGVTEVDLLDRVRLARLSRSQHPVVTLDLPEPETRQSGQHGSWQVEAAARKKQKRKAWTAAVSQVRPFEDPPARVRLHAHFRLWNLRDPWNLPGDLKYVIDALEQAARGGDELEWRRGLWPDCGYFVDDADAERGLITQEVDRDDRGLTLVVEVLDPDWEDPR